MTTGGGDLDAHRQLIGALAACAPAAYHGNAEFHAAVQRLAGMLRPMVLGLAVECQRNAERYRRGPDVLPGDKRASSFAAHLAGLAEPGGSRNPQPERAPDDGHWTERR